MAEEGEEALAVPCGKNIPRQATEFSPIRQLIT